MLRIVLFLLTNIAVLAVVSVVLSILGLGNPQTMTGMLVSCFVIGMAGSIISLFLSKSMAKRSTRTQLITQPTNQTEQWLFDTVKRLSSRAGIDMPEVGIFPSPQPNAFATGWNKNKALVAVSSGILQTMTKDELEAVIGHEIGHVANGDMVTLAMIQGIVNTFVIFLARIVDQMFFRNENSSGVGPAYFILQIIFGFLASAIVAWFSRYREFRADEAGARLSGKQNMINALAALKPASQQPDRMPERMKAFSISEGKSSGFSIKNLFASHPPLDVRIEALKKFHG